MLSLFDDINRVMLPLNAKWRLMPGSSFAEQTKDYDKLSYEYKKYVLNQDISLSERVDISAANETYETNNYIRFAFLCGIFVITVIGASIL